MGLHSSQHTWQGEGRSTLAGEAAILLMAGQGGGRRDGAAARVRAGLPSAHTSLLLLTQVENNPSSGL